MSMSSRLVLESGPDPSFWQRVFAEVMAFEIDDRLIPDSGGHLGRFDNVTVVNQDILKTDLQTQIQNFKNPDLPIKVVANLPATTSPPPSSCT